VPAIYLSLGSNQGDRLGYLMETINQIETEGILVLQRSPVYETAPWGFQTDALFLNQTLEVQSDLSPDAFHEILLQIEQRLGRKRAALPNGVGQQYESRTIDIDILFYGQEIILTPLLQVPHPKIQERRFVLEPLVDIAPDLIHPVLKQSMKTLLLACSDAMQVTIFKASHAGTENKIHEV
jgi:deoxyguanosine kinase